MSRIGKKIIEIPGGVQVQVGSHNHVTVTGPKGSLEFDFQPYVTIVVEENQVVLTVEKENNKLQRSVWGTSRAVLANMVTGVSTGFTRTIELNGVGYKMELGTQLKLLIGFSHPVLIDIPSNIKLELNKNVLSAESIDKHAVGDFIMNIHNMKPCDVYKQKGFKIPGKFYRTKVGKKGK